MNYQKHYDALIARAKNNILLIGVEQHHIVPRCLGGDNSEKNLVYLSYREHYIAHQLLVKLYPNNRDLISAAILMCYSSNNTRINNKLYSWLKKKNIDEISIPVYQFDLQGNFITKFNSGAEAARILNIDHGSIFSSAYNKTYNAGNYLWSISETLSKPINFRKNNLLKDKQSAICHLDINGNYIQTFSSVKEASERLNISVSEILRVCRGIRKSARHNKFCFLTQNMPV